MDVAARGFAWAQGMLPDEMTPMFLEV